MTTSGFLSAEAGFHSDRSRRVSFEMNAERDFVLDGGGREWSLSTEVDLRPTNAFSLSADIFYERNVDNLQYVDTARPAGVRSTCWDGSTRRRSGLTFRANVFLTPDLSIQYYGSPFVSNGSYGQFKRATSTPRADDVRRSLLRSSPHTEIGYVPRVRRLPP